MSQSLCVLIVEDSEDDVLLLKHTLRRGGYQVTCEVAQTPEAMRAALERHAWDIITSDHSMPAFSAPEALSLARELSPDTPFIIVSGEIDLNLAVSLMKGGARDYIQKRDMARLVPAVERELHEARLHRERQEMHAALIASEAKFRQIVETAAEGIVHMDSRERIIFANQQMAVKLGYTVEEMLGRGLDAFIFADQLEDHRAQMRQREEGRDAVYERCFKRRDGEPFWAQVSARVILDGDGNYTGSIGMYTDITDRKRMEKELENRLVSLTRPLDQTEDIRFEDLFDLETIQRLQDDFAAAAQVASIITHPDGTPITRPSQFCRLCAGIIRESDVGRVNCFKSDAVIGRHNPGGPIVQTCMSGGLWDAGAGITIGGRHIANWLIGQVRDETQTEEKIRAYAGVIGVDEEAVLAAFREVPAMSAAQFQRVAQALFTMANQLSNMAYMNIQQARFIAESRQAAEALRTSEENFREIFNSINEAIFIIAAETGQIIDVNEATLRLYGFAGKEAILAGNIAAVSANESPYSQSEALNLIQKTVVEGPQVFEWHAKHGDGSLFWTEISLRKSRFRGQDRILAVVRDITQRKREDAERDALLEIMQGLVQTKDLPEFLSLVHRAVAKVIFAINFFVVFYHRESGLFEEVYSVDQYDPPAPPSRLEKSLTAYTFRSGQPFIISDERFAELREQGVVDLVGTNSASWLGAPLNTPDGPIGVIAVQDYDNPDRYSENDKAFLAFISSQVALAIERKRGDEALRAANVRLELAQRSAGAGVWEWDLPSNQLSWSPHLYRIFGLDAEGAPISFDTWRRLVHPDDLPATIEEIDKAIHNFVPIFVEYRIITPAGETRWINTLGDTSLNERGEAVQMSGICLDVTRHRQAEEKLRRSEDNIRIIFETLSEGVALNEVILNDAGEMIDYRILEVNDAFYQVSGVDRSFPVVGCLATQLYGMDSSMIREFWQVHHAVNKTIHTEFASPQTQRIFLVSTSPIRDNRFVTSFHDITDRKVAETQKQAAQTKLEQLLAETEESRAALLAMVENQKQAEEEIRRLNAELEQRVADRTAQLTAANQEMEAFSYSVSHDLRAPLRRLDGFSGILMQDYAAQLDAQGLHYLSRIQESARRMDDLVNDLLTLSRITRAEFIRQPVDLSAITERIAADLAAQNPQRQVEFSILPNMNVNADGNLLRIVMENLLNNAFKFTSHKPRAVIEVTTAEQNGETVFCVRDNGAGFDMEYAERLFAPFQRLHSEKEFPGVGIGLATIKRIILRHGGRVWAEGQVDKGAAFYFTLG
jgi:PAS domain S-box-containing protein